jgi:RNA polymerase sigma-70 factor (ECF subfamily)
MVLRRARWMLRDEQAARDALHDVFLRVLQADRSGLDHPAPAAWLYRVTTNYCLNVLRDRARRTKLEARMIDPPVPTTSDARIQLTQILRHVRPELQEIAIYYLIDEMKHEEIATVLGVSRRTIGYRLEAFRAEVGRVLDAEPEASSVPTS